MLTSIKHFSPCKQYSRVLKEKTVACIEVEAWKSIVRNIEKGNCRIDSNKENGWINQFFGEDTKWSKLKFSSKS